MDSRGAGSHPQTLADYLAIVQRRKWIVIQTVVIVPVAAVLLTMQQPKEYSAESEVLLQRQTIGSALGEVEDPTTLDADRYASNQSEIARIPELAQRISRRVDNVRTADQILDASTVSPKSDADILEIKVTDRDPAVAARVATAYAREFVRFESEFATARYRRAVADVEDEIERMRASGVRDSSALMRSLFDSRNELRRLEALGGANVLVTKTADGAWQIAPQPRRNGMLGLMFGLVLGFGCAFIWEALDRRVRTDGEVERLLGLPLLARIPEPPREVRRRDRLVMISEPSKPEAEAFRRLRTNIDFANLEPNAKSIMVTSSVESEGKSTTVANLAVAFARAGRRVVLVDLDLRKPYLSKFFNLKQQPGITDVALGQVPLEEAIARVAIPSVGAVGGNGARVRNGNTAVTGVLEVLTSGPTPPNAGEFVATKALADILDDLEERADVVLIDAPPILIVGDAVTLSARVDAVMMVVRMNVVRRPMLREVRRFLDTCPSAPLGFVVAGGRDDALYGYGGYYHAPGARAAERERV